MGEFSFCNRPREQSDGGIYVAHRSESPIAPMYLEPCSLTISVPLQSLFILQTPIRKIQELSDFKE